MQLSYFQLLDRLELGDRYSEMFGAEYGTDFTIETIRLGSGLYNHSVKFLTDKGKVNFLHRLPQGLPARIKRGDEMYEFEQAQIQFDEGDECITITEGNQGGGCSEG